jgi:hypothetical protein
MIQGRVGTGNGITFVAPDAASDTAKSKLFSDF